jgi:transcriptional regulator with XRE-family HTH domain
MNSDYANALTIFGTALREARLSIGLSQEELADKIGLDRTYISSTERGKRNPSLLTIARLSVGLELSMSELLSRVELKPTL